MASEKFQIGCRLPISPDIVGDCEVDVVLATRVIGHPVGRPGVEEEGRCFFSTVAAALPGKESAAQIQASGVSVRLGQSSAPIEQQGRCQLRKAARQDWHNEQFVPEDVTAVCLAMESSCGNSDVEICCVGRQCLKYVKE